MSDHGDSHKRGGFSLGPLIGKLSLIGIPTLLIIMLGVSGIAFIKDSGIEIEPEAKATSTAAASAPPAAPTASADAAPAAEGAPATASDGGGDIDPAVMKLGQAAYSNCMACHGGDGKGIKAGPMSMAPALAGSELLLDEPDKSLLVVLKGIAKETNDYMGVMAPLAAALDDEKLAAVLTYSRNSFGNSGPAVTVEEAAAAREKFAEVPMMPSRTKIDEIVEAHK